MAKFQTEIKNEDAIRLGSCNVGVAPYGETTPEYVELGAARNVKLAEQIEIANHRARQHATDPQGQGTDRRRSHVNGWSRP